MNSPNAMRRFLAALALIALVGAACGNDDSADGADTGAQQEGVTITLLTHDSFAVSEGTLQAFTDETGIKVDVLMAGDAGAVVNQSILTKGEPLGDVLYGIDNTFLTRAFDEDLFVPYESPQLDVVTDDVAIDDEHRVTPIDLGDVCINYDKAAFDESGLAAPETLEDLTDPAYAGQLVVENPASSSPGLAFVLATIGTFGEDGWRDYWADLRANDVEVAEDWENAYYGSFSAASDGDRPLVVSYASSPAAEVFFAEEELPGAPTGVMADSCFRQIEYAGILDGTEHEEAAQELIDFMLSKQFQEDIPLNMFVFPVREDAQLPDVFVENTTLPTDPIELTPEQIGADRDRWIDEWTETVVR